MEYKSPYIKRNFDIDYSEYTHKYGGHLNLELNKKIELVNKISDKFQKSVGEYVKEHHKYFKQNVNYNQNDCCNLSIINYNNPQLTLFT